MATTINATKQESKRRLGFRRRAQLFRAVFRYNKHPDAFDAFFAYLENEGVSVADMAALREACETWRETSLRSDAAAYRADLFMTAGLGAAELVLLPVIIPLGVPDRSLFLATLSLAVSLVFVGGALSINFIKKDSGKTEDDGLHALLRFVGAVFGAISFTAAFWHLSTIIGVTFLVLVSLMFFICTWYSVRVMYLPGFRQIRQALDEL